MTSAKTLSATVLCLALALSAHAADAPKPAAPAAKPAPTAQEIIDAAPPEAWSTYPAEDLVVMTLGDKSTVVYALAPAFAAVHVANIRTLVRSGWFDGAAIIRVQDGFVTQWGRADEAEDDKGGRKPEGITTPPPAEYEFPAQSVKLKPLPFADTYAPKVGYAQSWPAASDGKTTWLTHCYGMIGVARGLAPDTGSGTQLYTIIGQAPRRLDRNLAVVARVVAGMENLSNRPRGTEALGFYKTPAEHVPIVSARLMSDLPEAERKVYQVLNPASTTFKAWLNVKTITTNSFYVKAPGAIDLCNALPPVRVRP